ncbi:MAG: Bax inhibitor-1/YccA family protein [Clostridium sp.]|nr:Bax inhibitor-1/YccA family protein [Bacteroides sp.]MCM1198825.1 Bax inhibitor-1/YccA family protein [Clostridium sp.]
MDNYNTYERGQALDLPQAFSVLMRNVYSWMTGGLLVTAFVALLAANSYELMYTIASTPALMWGLFIAELAVVLIFTSRIMKMSFATAAILFVAYAVLNGLTLSFIFMVYTAESIAQTFFITAGTFAGMSLIGYMTKKDLSAIGRALYMLLIGLIIATVVNIFMKNSGLAMILNYAGVIIFTGLTAYDTQKIKNMLLESSAEGVNEQTNKLALLGSLNLYLDFINLFLYLLRLFGNRK